MSKKNTKVNAHAQLLGAALQELQTGGSKPILGVSDRCVLGSRAQAIEQIRRVLIDSGRVFLLDRNVVFESRSNALGYGLVTLLSDGHINSASSSYLAGLFHGVVYGDKGITSFQVPAKLITEVLVHPDTIDALPQIDCYSLRPCFDSQYQLLGPGYHADARTLVHGQPVTPVIWTPAADATGFDRVPPLLRGLLQDFAFDSVGDLVHTIAMLLTGILVTRFIAGGKPLFVINGNQKGVGKTLLATVVGIVLDGEDPPLIHHTDDEDELGKRLGAKIRPGHKNSVLFFDNRKGTIGGSLIESLALASKLSVRELGKNADITRQNDFVWVFTANNAKATSDMTDRGVIVELRYEGDPKVRFASASADEEELKAYARNNRVGILGELMGFVVNWCDADRPDGQRVHRVRRWSKVVGGILKTAGFGDEFLANQEAAAAELDEGLNDLAALAEYTVAKINTPGHFTISTAPGTAQPGRKPSDWLNLFHGAGVCPAASPFNGSKRSQESAAGRFFGPMVGRSVQIDYGSGTATAELKKSKGSARSKYYWFEVTPLPPSTVVSINPAPVCTASSTPPSAATSSSETPATPASPLPTPTAPHPAASTAPPACTSSTSSTLPSLPSALPQPDLESLVATPLKTCPAPLPSAPSSASTPPVAGGNMLDWSAG